MNSTVPADLLKLKVRREVWRATRRYARQPIPDELLQRWRGAIHLRSPNNLYGLRISDPCKMAGHLQLRLPHFYEHTPNVFNIIKFVGTVVHLHTKLVGTSAFDRQSFAVLR